MPESLNKVADLEFIEKETQAQMFSCEFCHIYKNTYFKKKLRATASGYLSSYIPLSPVSQFSSLRCVISMIAANYYGKWSLEIEKTKTSCNWDYTSERLTEIKK